MKSFGKMLKVRAGKTFIENMLSSYTYIYAYIWMASFMDMYTIFCINPEAYYIFSGNL